MRFRFAALLCVLLVAPALAQQAPSSPPPGPGVQPATAAPAPDPSDVRPPDTSTPTDELAAAPAPPEPPPAEPAVLPPETPEQAGEQVLPEASPAQEPLPDGAPAPDEAVAETAPPGEVHRVVVLQPEFRVFVQSAGGVREIEPDWTGQAQNALALAVERHLRHDPRFAVAAPVEPATAEEATLLREHVELFKLIASNASMMIRFGGKAWQEKQLQYDYTLGDGLAPYGDLSNADYAFMIGGAQVKQTGGSVFMQLALAGTLGVVMPGGGTYLMLALVDIRTGNIVWFNSLEGGEVFGMTGSDLRKEDAADEVVGRLLDPFPASPLFNTKIF
jgi:hypothetical protein